MSPPATGAAGSRPSEDQGIAYDNRNHSPGLAALRGIAAIGVLAYHSLLIMPLTGEDGPGSQQGIFDEFTLLERLLLGLFNGPGLVVLFFVLSGCVLAMSLERRATFSPADLLGYWIRRGFRLYPLLIVAATFGALLQLMVGSSTVPYASEWANWQYDVPLDELAVAWLKNVAGMSFSLNSPAWSIRVELLASFLFPLLFALTLKPMAAVIGLATGLLLMFGLPPREDNYFQMHTYLASFLLGALVPRYGRRMVDAFGRLGRASGVLVLMILALLFMFARQTIESVQPDSNFVIIIESLVATMVVALALFRPGPAFVRSRAVQSLGRISYGIYLLHLIVLMGLVHLLFPALPPAVSDRGLLVSLLLFLVTTVITLPLSWWLYDLIEAPLQKLGSKAARVADKQMRSGDYRLRSLSR